MATLAGSTRGPAGKRDAERVRRNQPAGGPATQFDSSDFDKLPFEVELLVQPPAADDEWHEVARMQYDALLRDPARIWMGPADWALSYLMCESLSRELKPQAIGIVDGGYDPETGETVAGHVAREIVPMKGNTVTAVLKWYASIGVTESARLGLRKEVTFNQPETNLKSVGEGDVVQIRPKEGHFSTGPTE